MSYLVAATKAAIEVKAKLSEKYKITILGLARQYLGLKVYHNEIGTGSSLRQKAYKTTILKQFGMGNRHDFSTPMDRNIKFDLAKVGGEKELEEITDYQEVMG